MRFQESERASERRKGKQLVMIDPLGIHDRSKEASRGLRRGAFSI